MITAAIVGLGWWGQQMVAAVRGEGHRLCFRFAVGRDPANDAKIAARNKLVLLGSLEEALRHPAVEAVVLATPHSLHAPQILACAAAGKPVFSEKPLALTLGEAQRAVVACRDAGIVLGIGTDRRFLPVMRELKEWVASERLGRILHLEAQYSNDAMSQGLSGAWRRDPAEAPGAGMTGPGLHALDGLIDLAGPVTRLTAQFTALTVRERPSMPSLC
jgi:predicted dehydrogenase